MAPCRRSALARSASTARSWNSGITPLGEQLQGLTDVLVAVPARLAHEDQLVDPGRFVLPDQGGDLRRCTDRAPQRPETMFHELSTQLHTRLCRHATAEAESVTVLLEFLPHVGHTGFVRTEHVVVGERVPEEVTAIEAAIDGSRLVGVTHERKDARQVGVDRETGRHAILEAIVE